MELTKFFQDYIQSNTAITPIRFKKALGYTNNLFNNCNQHDSHEFLIFLFDKLSIELSRKVVMNIKCNNNINEYKMVYNKVQHTKNNKILNSKYKEKLELLRRKYMKDIYIIKSLSSWKMFFEKNYSDLINIVYGQLLSSINCNECSYISIKFEPFTTINKQNVTKT